MIQTVSGRKDCMTMIHIAAKAISDKKGCELVAFDVTGVSAITDYVLIVSGLNTPHLKAMVNETIVQLKNNGFHSYRKSGEPDSGWIIVDYLDLMLHFFSRIQREYYGLDQLFKDAPELSV